MLGGDDSSWVRVTCGQRTTQWPAAPQVPPPPPRYSEDDPQPGPQTMACLLQSVPAAPGVPVPAEPRVPAAVHRWGRSHYTLITTHSMFCFKYMSSVLVDLFNLVTIDGMHTVIDRLSHFKANHSNSPVVYLMCCAVVSCFIEQIVSLTDKMMEKYWKTLSRERTSAKASWQHIYSKSARSIYMTKGNLWKCPPQKSPYHQSHNVNVSVFVWQINKSTGVKT